ncbi:cell division protein ZapA [Sphingomonas naphthae]|uniref:Cell division protein ZapA n=1 Tax=Sphingomonas naphthae TaxID=1813468 RepID=A0ABY7TP58_9SPHN|nr:cell division protein ZapA [Sphingomonas naphthae]WCT74813.1 cell division protein ZapA [Sphingomonas naphthae]
MAQVDLKIAGRTYEIACRDGEETHLTALAAIVDQKASQAGRAVGGVNEARQLLLASLLLADELNDLRKGVPAPTPTTEPGEQNWPGLAPLLDELAERLEKIAAGLATRRPV